MRREASFLGPSRAAYDDVREWPRGEPAEPTSFPLSKIFGDGPFTSLSEQQPWFPARSRHDRDIGELRLCVLRAVTPAERLRETNHLAALLKSRINERLRHDVRKQWIRRDKNVGARNDDRQEHRGEFTEELVERRDITIVQHGKAGHRCALVSAERRRDSPHTAPAGAKLAHLVRGVFEHAVGRVGDHSFKRVPLLRAQPAQAVGLVELRQTRRRKKQPRNGRFV